MDNQSLQAFDTARLHLRPLGEGDGDFYCSFYSDAGIMKYIAEPMTRDAALRSHRAAVRQQSPDRQRWIVSDRQSGPAGIGLVGLFVEGSAAEIGIMLHALWRGGGRAEELIEGFANRLFSSPETEVLWAQHAARNRPAYAVMPKLGFCQRPMQDREATHIRWSIEREQWLARQANGGQGSERHTALSGSDRG